MKKTTNMRRSIKPPRGFALIAAVIMMLIMTAAFGAFYQKMRGALDKSRSIRTRFEVDLVCQGLGRSAVKHTQTWLESGPSTITPAAMRSAICVGGTGGGECPKLNLEFTNQDSINRYENMNIDTVSVLSISDPITTILTSGDAAGQEADLRTARIKIRVTDTVSEASCETYQWVDFAQAGGGSNNTVPLAIYSAVPIEFYLPFQMYTNALGYVNGFGGTSETGSVISYTSGGYEGDPVYGSGIYVNGDVVLLNRGKDVSTSADSVPRVKQVYSTGYFLNPNSTSAGWGQADSPANFTNPPTAITYVTQTSFTPEGTGSYQHEGLNPESITVTTSGTTNYRWGSSTSSNLATTTALSWDTTTHRLSNSTQIDDLSDAHIRQEVSASGPSIPHLYKSFKLNRESSIAAGQFGYNMNTNTYYMPSGIIENSPLYFLAAPPSEVESADTAIASHEAARNSTLAMKADIRIINGIWYINDGTWPGQAIWSDHAGNYTVDETEPEWYIIGNAEASDTPINVTTADNQVGQRQLRTALGWTSTPRRYSYYEAEVYADGTADMGIKLLEDETSIYTKPSVVSYGGIAIQSQSFLDSYSDMAQAYTYALPGFYVNSNQIQRRGSVANSYTNLHNPLCAAGWREATATSANYNYIDMSDVGVSLEEKLIPLKQPITNNVNCIKERSCVSGNRVSIPAKLLAASRIVENDGIQANGLNLGPSPGREFASWSRSNKHNGFHHGLHKKRYMNVDISALGLALADTTMGELGWHFSQSRGTIGVQPFNGIIYIANKQTHQYDSAGNPTTNRRANWPFQNHVYMDEEKAATVKDPFPMAYHEMWYPPHQVCPSDETIWSTRNLSNGELDYYDTGFPARPCGKGSPYVDMAITPASDVRLINGSNLAAFTNGLTVVSPNEVTILGEYNNPFTSQFYDPATYLLEFTRHPAFIRPAAIVADAITVLGGQEPATHNLQNFLSVNNPSGESMWVSGTDNPSVAQDVGTALGGIMVRSYFTDVAAKYTGYPLTNSIAYAPSFEHKYPKSTFRSFNAPFKNSELNYYGLGFPVSDVDPKTITVRATLITGIPTTPSISAARGKYLGGIERAIRMKLQEGNFGPYVEIIGHLIIGWVSHYAWPACYSNDESFGQMGCFAPGPHWMFNWKVPDLATFVPAPGLDLPYLYAYNAGSGGTLYFNSTSDGESGD